MNPLYYLEKAMTELTASLEVLDDESPITNLVRDAIDSVDDAITRHHRRQMAQFAELLN